MSDPAAMRRRYERGELGDGAAAVSWLGQFRVWFAEAVVEASVLEPNAMQVATVDAAGRPSVRTVLIKGFDDRGVDFYTNYDSEKARDLAVNPYAAAVLVWLPLERQVRLSGAVARIDRAETEAYFASRPRGSQLGAWASPQSRVVASRAELDALMAAAEERFAGIDVPAPPNWGGYRIAVELVEFWQGRPDRLHDRIRHRLDRGSWVTERLAP